MDALESEFACSINDYVDRINKVYAYAHINT
jgi:hypothetical protein